MSIEKGFAREYSCPVCELKAWLIKRLELNESQPLQQEGFLGQLGEEIKSRGLTRGKEWSFCYDTRSGPVIDDKTAYKIPVGTEIPGYGIMTDVCPTCGTVYATKMTRLEGKTRPDIQKPGQGGLGRNGTNPLFGN